MSIEQHLAALATVQSQLDDLCTIRTAAAGWGPRHERRYRQLCSLEQRLILSEVAA
jgi:hypothetical protein